MDLSMVDYTFVNSTDETVGFKIYQKYVWKASSEMIVSVADASSVDLRFKLRQMKKEIFNNRDLIATVRQLVNLITEEFPEGSTGFNIRLLEPKKAPVVEVKFTSPFMYVGDEMKFEVHTENLPGEILAFIPERDVAMVLKDGRTIKAVGPGKAFLKVGTKEFNRRFDLVVETPPKANIEE